MYDICKTRKTTSRNYRDKVNQFRTNLNKFIRKTTLKMGQHYNRSNRSRYKLLYQIITIILHIILLLCIFRDHTCLSNNCLYIFSMWFQSSIRNLIIFHENQLMRHCESVQMNRISCSLSVSVSFLSLSLSVSLSLPLSPSLSLSLSLSFFLCLFCFAC